MTIGPPGDAATPAGIAAAAEEPAPEDQTRSAEDFSGRVLSFFATQVLTAALGIFNGFFLARLIGPSGKGDYYLVTFLPPTLMVLGQLGLPQAIGFFSARARTRGLVRTTVVLAVGIAVPMLAVVFALMPVIQSAGFHGLDATMIVVPLLCLPLILNATFTTGVVVGRQAARWLAIVYPATSAAATVLIVVLAGILGLGVWGAILAYVATSIIQFLGFMFAAVRVSRTVPSPGTVRIRELFRYGLPYYPGSLTSFFSYRADVYLLALLLADPAAPLGYYSLSVSFAELVFFLPNAVAAFFFPHVAGGNPEDSARQVPLVSRVTLLVTAATGLALVPASYIAIHWLLPSFEQSLAPLYILLPGVVAISVSKVLAGYLSGLGRTGTTSVVSIAAFALNVVINILLIPPFGILGAAAASLISYTASSIAYSVLSARLAGVSWTAFWIPRASDVRFTITTSAGILRRLLRRGATAG
jgi:O-antigen/teichoic acid export membrane protein